MKPSVLFADDEVIFLETFTKVLEEEGWAVTAVTDGLDAIEAAQKQTFDMMILDIQMPGADGIKVLTETMKIAPDTPVLLITAYGSVQMAVEAIRLGARDYVVKPVIFEDILAKIKQQVQFNVLEKENIVLKQQLQCQSGAGNMISQSPLMNPVFETINKVTHTKSSVLITGESGTGKELVARAIHTSGVTEHMPFVAINCSAIPESLLESELFGHKKGSFTTAVEDKQGLFETARGGTLFLDEIGFMPMGCQVKLLRALEERKILSVGMTTPIEIDVRVVAATNKDLPGEISAGRFREDLYYRINVVGIHLPPLRDRREDVPLLVDHFLQKYNQEMGKSFTGVSDEVLQVLMNHEWKGNIRELQNVIERAVIFGEGDLIHLEDMGMHNIDRSMLSHKDENLAAALKSYERAHLHRVLDKYPSNKQEAAKALGIGLSSLYRKIDELGIAGGSHTRK